MQDPGQVFTAGPNPTKVNGVEVSWTAVPGQTYLIHYSANLTNASWTYLGTVNCKWKTCYFADTNASHAANKTGFYRLFVSP